MILKTEETLSFVMVFLLLLKPIFCLAITLWYLFVFHLTYGRWILIIGMLNIMAYVKIRLSTLAMIQYHAKEYAKYIDSVSAYSYSSNLRY